MSVYRRTFKVGCVVAYDPNVPLVVPAAAMLLVHVYWERVSVFSRHPSCCLTSVCRNRVYAGPMFAAGAT